MGKMEKAMISAEDIALIIDSILYGDDEGFEDALDIGFDGYICGCGMYIECGKEVIFQHKLPQKLCDSVAELIYECDMTPMYEHSKSFFTDKRCRSFEGFMKLKRRFENQGKNLSPDVSDDNFAFDKLLAWYDEKRNMNRSCTQVSSYTFIRCLCHRR